MPLFSSSAPGDPNGKIPEAEGCTRKRWRILPCDAFEVAALAASANVPPVLALLLWSREIRSPEAVARFLNPSLDQMHEPSLLCGMTTAVARIVQAVRAHEPILIYGDYDVDGTLATVLLKTAIDRISPKDLPSLVRYHIPHRIREGYGVQAHVLADAAASGVRLVISVDTGIRAFAAADEARALSLDLIITDHHLPEQDRIPDAVAVINPNQRGCSYPEKHLCGAAVAYKLAEALLRAAASEVAGLQKLEMFNLRAWQMSLLKLVAIATVADAVPLTGENRSIAALGLAELRQVRQPGLRALMRLARVGGDGKSPLAQEIAFRIAPRINAAGRMDVAGDVVRLLLTREEEEAHSLALKLHTLNEERRNVEAAVLLDLHQQIDGMATSVHGTGTPGIFVMDGQAWHRGVVGILASRVVDRTNRPALVITHEDGAAHGSGRSVEGFHLLDALTSAHREHREETTQDLFLRFGGHAHAVGFSLPSANVEPLRTRLLRLAESFSDQATMPALAIDAEMPLDEANREFWQWLCRLQPFGHGNAEPVFCATGLRVMDIRDIKERHLKLRLQTSQGKIVDCMCWARSFSWPERTAEHGIKAGCHIDLAYQLRWSEHPDFGGLEITACDLRLTASEPMPR